MKKIFLFAALTLSLFLTSCKDAEPFDTQDANDYPLILVPYETKSGLITYTCANPGVPLTDSVIVTPSRYTTVNWYLDGQLVWTGNKISMCFPVGTYAVTIEAVTEAGKRTERHGSLSVLPYGTDPYAAPPTTGRHVAAAKDVVLDGKNLNLVDKVLIAEDLYAEKEVCKVDPSAKTASQLTFALPDIADKKYYLRFIDAEGQIYGSDALFVHHTAVVQSGYDSFFPGELWTIEGINLTNVASVLLDDIEITAITATETTISFMAPDGQKGHTYRISMRNADGTDVLFATSTGTVTQMSALCTDQTPIWTGPVALAWDEKLIQIAPATLATLHVGDSLFVYFDKPAAEYYQMRVTIPNWEKDYYAQRDMTTEQSPYVFIYDENCETLAKANYAMCFVGFGPVINKITYKHK